jgi:hypothetical protein
MQQTNWQKDDNHFIHAAAVDYWWQPLGLLLCLSASTHGTPALRTSLLKPLCLPLLLLLLQPHRVGRVRCGV